MALLNIPDLGNHTAALTKRAAVAPSGAVSPSVGTAPSPTHASSTAGVTRAAVVMGGPLSLS